MRVIIEEMCDKTWRQEDNTDFVKGLINSKYPLTEMIIRDVRRTTLAEIYARNNNIPLVKIPNSETQVEEMIENADALIAIWDGNKEDIKQTICCMNKKGKPVFLYLVEKHEEF